MPVHKLHQSPKLLCRLREHEPVSRATDAPRRMPTQGFITQSRNSVLVYEVVQCSRHKEVLLEF